jgi:hypothetical protein
MIPAPCNTWSSTQRLSTGGKLRNHFISLSLITSVPRANTPLTTRSLSRESTFASTTCSPYSLFFVVEWATKHAKADIARQSTRADSVSRADRQTQERRPLNSAPHQHHQRRALRVRRRPGSLRQLARTTHLRRLARSQWQTPQNPVGRRCCAALTCGCPLTAIPGGSTTADMKVFFQFLGWGSFLLLLIVGSRFNFAAHLIFTAFTMLVCFGAGVLSGEDSALNREKDSLQQRIKRLQDAGYDPQPYHFKCGITIPPGVKPGNN